MQKPIHLPILPGLHGQVHQESYQNPQNLSEFISKAQEDITLKYILLAQLNFYVGFTY